MHLTVLLVGCEFVLFTPEALFQVRYGGSFLDRYLAAVDVNELSH